MKIVKQQFFFFSHVVFGFAKQQQQIFCNSKSFKYIKGFV